MAEPYYIGRLPNKCFLTSNPILNSTIPLFLLLFIPNASARAAATGRLTRRIKYSSRDQDPGGWVSYVHSSIHHIYIYITLGVLYFRMESALTFSLVACCFFVVASDNPPFFGDCELFLSIFVSIIYLSFSGYYSLL